MCGRYDLALEKKRLESHYGIPVESDIAPRYNIAPGQQILVLREKGFSYLKWGLVPHWAKDTKIAFKLINARSETILEKPSFREAFKKRRCLIPATGFYEWEKIGKTKQPYRFSMKDGSVFSFSGIWESWNSPEGNIIETCSILTTAPNELMRSFHVRMPVVLDSRHYNLWLTEQRAEKLVELLVPFDTERMLGYEVDQIVNSPKNDMPVCIQAI